MVHRPHDNEGPGKNPRTCWHSFRVLQPPSIPLPFSQKIVSALQTVRSSRMPFVGLFMEKETGELASDAVTTTARPLEELHTMGALASLQSLMETPDGGVGAWFLAHRRIKWMRAVTADLPPIAKVHHLERLQGEANTDMVRALSNEILQSIRTLVRINPLMKEQMQYFMQRLEVHDAYKLADFAASMTNADPVEAQAVLEAETLQARLETALDLLKKEEEIAKMQQRIQAKTDEQMKESQRKYFLQEQLKSIKKELGIEKDDKDALVTKFQDRAKDLDMPESAKIVFEEELEKLQVLERNSSEFNVTRSYLDWMTTLPWGVYSEDTFDLEAARKVLDADHYGMSDVKERILEFIAVGKLRGSTQGKIMLLVGPPGVGKTSIGSSIAKALGRKFYRFSVGGLHDVAEIKGHRRTYVGAMPGKLIQGMKSVKVSNPLVLIDEVDKIGSGRTGLGDPSSALLEMLDPNQNEDFMDHYLDTPYDASKVLFLCTANSTDTIPGPLLDRMEVIQLSGYDAPEKVQIAKRYLDPKTRKETGLDADLPSTPQSLQLDESAIEALIKGYCRESGVRNLEKHIGRIYRKAALKIVTEAEKREAAAAAASDGEADSEHASGERVDSVDSGAGGAAATTPDETDWRITAANLADYVGKPVFTSDRMYDDTPPGVVMGLAWTSMGGASLYIEATTPTLITADAPEKAGKVEYTGSLKLTGKAGEVMQESSTIAHTLARKLLRRVPGQDHNTFLERCQVHMHVPEGATPKDGPSAGVTMTTSLLSLATDQAIRSDLAMTGEVTLTGKVLPVGGIKEKTMAARRAGVSCLVFPEQNRKDWEELADHLKEGMEVHFAERYEQVYEVAFGKPLP